MSNCRTDLRYGLVEQPVVLRPRYAKLPDDLAGAQWRPLDRFPNLAGQLIQKYICHVPGIAIVFKHMIDVNRALISGFENIDKTFVVQLAIHINLDDPTPFARCWPHNRIRERIGIFGRANFKYPFSVIRHDLLNFHSSPSSCNSRMYFKI